MLPSERIQCAASNKEDAVTVLSGGGGTPAAVIETRSLPELPRPGPTGSNLAQSQHDGVPK